MLAEQLEEDFKRITEQNRENYEKLDREYQNLQREIPEIDCVIIHLRETAVYLRSEINTYRYLLTNLCSTPDEVKFSSFSRKQTEPVQPATVMNKNQYRDETTGFVVHVEDGMIWVRI